MNQVNLPWPSPNLFPNKISKNHWSTTSKAKKKAKSDAYLMSNGKLPVIPLAKSVNVNLVFNQPDNHRRDQDNMISACKAYLDGVAQSIGVDDSKFNITAEFPDKREKPGSVIIQIQEAA